MGYEKVGIAQLDQNLESTVPFFVGEASSITSYLMNRSSEINPVSQLEEGYEATQISLNNVEVN